MTKDNDPGSVASNVVLAAELSLICDENNDDEYNRSDTKNDASSSPFAPGKARSDQRDQGRGRHNRE